MQRCPVCAREIPEFPRYPRMLCADCMKRARDKNGRPVGFSNQDFSGGLVGRYADSDEPYPFEDCYVDGLPCRAEEGRFGGVVIQVLT